MTEHPLGRLFGLLLAAGLFAVLADSRPFALEPHRSTPARTASQIPANSGAISWDFETGNLSGWTAAGLAFRSQPTLDDNTVYRNSGPANIQGRYWIGTFEAYRPNLGKPGATQGDGPTGTLTSNAFTIPPSLTFRVGGGSSRLTRVELFVSDPDGARSAGSASGKNSETMEDVTWDLQQYAGQQGFIRIFDESSGPWGHINVDDFRFGRPLRGVEEFRGGATPTPESVPTTTTVPNLYGLTPNEAEALLKKHRLNGTQTGTAPTNDKPGTVFRQTHEPNSSVPVGTVLGYTVATPLPTVPNVIGQREEAATVILGQTQFVKGKTIYLPSRTAKGQVIDQSSKAGTRLAPGSAIDLVVAVPITVQVPPLLGMTQPDASKVLGEKELKLGAIATREARELRGSILSQSPAAGTQVEIGTGVDVVIAKLVTVTVPNLLTLSETDARQTLQDAELVVGDLSQEESKAELNSVLRQGIPAGERVDIGTSVDVVTATMVTVEVPNLTLLAESEARLLLVSAELQAQPRYQESPVKPGTVLEQDTAAGLRLPIQSGIGFVVAAAQTIEMPRVVGMTIEEAKQQLRLIQLTVAGEPLRYVASESRGIVLEQSAAPGTRVPVGSGVVLTLSTPAMVSVPDLRSRTRADAAAGLENLGLKLGSVSSRWSYSTGGTVIGQSVQTGTRVEFGATVGITEANAFAAWSLTGGIALAAAGLLEIRRRRRPLPAPPVTPLEVIARPHVTGHVLIATSGDNLVRLEVRLKPVRDCGSQDIGSFEAGVIKSERRIRPGQGGTL